MIEKKIHFCWFGGGKQNLLIRRCLASWQYYLKDFEYVLWDENRFDPMSHPFTADAYKMKKYAFVADFVRMKALFEEGGIYLDTDVEVKKDFDDLLSSNFFIGSEAPEKFSTAVIGAKRGHWLPQYMLDFYDKTEFVKNDIKSLVNVNHVSKALIDKGFSNSDEIQHIKGDTIYPLGVFSEGGRKLFVTNRSSYATHLYIGSWKDGKNRAFLRKSFRYARKRLLLDVESLLKLAYYKLAPRRQA